MLRCDIATIVYIKEHELNCNYVPEQCKNLGCSRRVSKFDMEGHLKECGYAMVECRFCKTKMKRLVIEVGWFLLTLQYPAFYN